VKPIKALSMELQHSKTTGFETTLPVAKSAVPFSTDHSSSYFASTLFLFLFLFFCLRLRNLYRQLSEARKTRTCRKQVGLWINASIGERLCRKIKSRFKTDHRVPCWHKGRAEVGIPTMPPKRRGKPHLPFWRAPRKQVFHTSLNSQPSVGSI
jgi:hypothetical protein